MAAPIQMNIKAYQSTTNPSLHPPNCRAGKH